MNDFNSPESEFEMPAQTRENFPMKAGTGLLVALGVGLAVGALIHALRPAPKPHQRLAKMIEDMEGNLREMSAPALNKVGTMAASGAQRLGKELHRGEAQMDRLLRDVSKRLRRMAF